MNKIVTITGELGSGKSTVARALSKVWRCSQYSVGDAQRNMAQTLGVSTLELNKMAENDPNIDKQIDSIFTKLAANDNDCVIDSRLAWHFLPYSLKVKFNVSGAEAVSRILCDKDRVSEDRSSAISVRDAMLKRRLSERKRFKGTYGVDVDDDNNFDIVIDTTDAPLEAIIQIINSALEKKKAGHYLHRQWVAAQSLYPTEDVRKLCRDGAVATKNSISDQGYDDSFPVMVARDKFSGNFIFDGHQRTSGAIFSGIKMIPTVPLTTEHLRKGESVDLFIHSNTNLSIIYDWEDVHKFKFKNYPDFHVK